MADQLIRNHARLRMRESGATEPEPDPLIEAYRQWKLRGWQAPDELVAASSVIRAQQIVVSRINAVLKPTMLSFARYEVLVVLYFSRRPAMPLGKVSRLLSVHPTSITSLTSRLVQDGYIRRVRNGHDRRSVLAQITDEGRAVVERMAPLLGAAGFGLADLGSMRAQELTRLLNGLRAGPSELGGGLGEA